MTERAMKQALAALDTAHGCLELVAANVKPVDLDECRREIDDARATLAKALGHD